MHTVLGYFQSPVLQHFLFFNECKECCWPGLEYLLGKSTVCFHVCRNRAFFSCRMWKQENIMQLCNYNLVSTAIIKCFVIKTCKISCHEVSCCFSPDQYNLPTFCKFWLVKELLNYVVIHCIFLSFTGKSRICLPDNFYSWNIFEDYSIWIIITPQCIC